MTPRKLHLLLFALVAIGTVTAQNDELQIPVENDNQFPPDKQADTIDGSGDGVIEEPEEADVKTVDSEPPPIEHTQTRILFDDIASTPTTEGDDDLCPKPCVCRIEGSSNDFVVDCSGYDLTEIPMPINEKTTVLNLQKNKLIELPREISTLKNLKVLNANDNSIMTLAPGSVSELPALVTLKLGNNRLIEYPNDLKNSFGLTKLEELDLGRNDMRTELSADIFAKFEALRTIILPASTPELQQSLCDLLPTSLENICSGSCENQLFECQGDGKGIEDELPVIPGMISFDNEDNNDPTVNTPPEETTLTEENAEPMTTESTLKTIEKNSFRVAVDKQPNDIVAHTAIVEAPKDTGTPETPVKIGAATTDTKTGGVDKSIIGLVVAGMVVIVAGITIKKNWSSIKKRFGSNSNSRTPNERNGTNANGAAPEEVPLQDKSPV